MHILVPGNWSVWSDWHRCVNYRQTRNRTCSNPDLPTYCKGPIEQTVLCYDVSEGNVGS